MSRISQVVCAFVLFIALLYAIIAVKGCQTFDGVKGDIHWLTADESHN